MSAALQAGNTASSLSPKPATPATSPAPEEHHSFTEEIIAEKKSLEQIKANFAKSEIAKQNPKPSAPAPATGPAPVEWKEPARGPKSPSAPPSTLDGGVSSLPHTALTAPSATVTRAEFQELLDRIETFNTRSSQKI